MSPVVVITGPGRTPLHLVLLEPVEIGRAGPGFLLDDAAVSRRHLELRPDGAEVIARDLGSANGTTLDGVLVTEPVRIGPEQALVLGDTTIRLAGTTGSTLTPTEIPAPDPAEMTSIERVADAVVRESAGGAVQGSAVQGSAFGGHTRTIVFSDIEGSTDLAVGLGDVAWFELLEVHNSILRACLVDHDGIEVKSQGDGFMLTFPSARRGVAYMVDMQRRLAAHPDMTSHGLRVRVGAHTGEAIEADDGDLFGQAVIVAARIGAAAAGGEILVSSVVREIVESWDEVDFGPPRVVALKGLAREWNLHPVEWQEREGVQ